MHNCSLFFSGGLEKNDLAARSEAVEAENYGSTFAKGYTLLFVATN